MSNGHKINWRESDNRLLAKAVQRFNAKITRTLKKAPALAAILPDKVSVQDIKQRFSELPRSAFNRELKKLGRFSRPEAVTPYTTKSGVTTTLWQKREIDNSFKSINAQRRAQLNKYQPSVYTGTLHTIQDMALKPRQNTVEKIEPKYWDKFVNNLEAQMLTGRQDKNVRYKENFLKAINNIFGEGSAVYEAVNKLTPEKAIEFYHNSPFVSLTFVYSYEQLEMIENKILTELGVK